MLKKAGVSSLETAESTGISALTFLAQDDERLSRFIALTGIAVESMRAAAQEPAFLAAVLEHIAQDQALMTEFATFAGVPLAAIDTARRALGGHDWERETA